MANLKPLSTKAFWCQNNPREAAEEIERLRELLERVKTREWNPFERDNQSRLYIEICNALESTG